MKIKSLAKRLYLFIFPLLGGIGGGLMCACDAETTYTRYPCYLVIDNSVHQDATLASAMNIMSPGVFCTITNNEAKQQYSFVNNCGLSSVKAYNAIDKRRTRALGMNGALIVGFGTLTGEFYAYDRECPVCFSPDDVPVRSKPVTTSSDGIATCSVCKRRFDMNNGGNCVSEGGISGLRRYRASMPTGPFGVLSVGN